MSKRQTNIWENTLANHYNEMHGKIGIGLCYNIINTFGDSKYSHEFCEWINNERKSNNTYKMKFDELCSKFNDYMSLNHE